MSVQRVIANSSSGQGLCVSIDQGKRVEYFLNSSLYWFYAAENCLDESYYDWELKNPELGRLSIFRKKWKGNSAELVAAFPKNSWEFVRLLESGYEDSSKVGYTNPDSDDRNLCPEGCWVRGYRDLSAETREAHMSANHKSRR